MCSSSGTISYYLGPLVERLAPRSLFTVEPADFTRFLVFTCPDFHFRHGMSQQCIRKTHVDRTEGGEVVVNCKNATRITLTAPFYLFIPDVHWQRGDLHEPLQVTAHLHT